MSKVQNLMETIGLELEREETVKIDFLEAMYDRAKNLFITEQWDEAYKLFKQVEQINPDYQATQMYIGITEEEMATDEAA